jgi:hypothetical protein
VAKVARASSAAKSAHKRALLREAQSIAGKNKRAASKLAGEFEADRVWQRKNGPTV